MNLDHPAIKELERWGELNKYEAVYYCDICGEEIYEGDAYYKIDSCIWCEACIEERKKLA